MGNTKRIEVRDLRSQAEIGDAIAERKKNVARAEEFITKTFGHETVMAMLRQNESIPTDKPAFVLSRQIAKPDMQYNALYMSAKHLDGNLVTLEWLDDFISTQRGYYKRTYIDVPIGSISRSGDLYAKNLRIVEHKELVKLKFENRHNLRNIVVPSATVSEFKKVMERMNSAVASELRNGEDHVLPEFYVVLRRSMGLRDDIVVDCSSVGAVAASFVVENSVNVPGADKIKYKRGADGIEIEAIGGQFMNLVVFSMQNRFPNMLLAVTDWNNDDEIIRDRYDNAVSFLRKNGLNEPLQVFIPSMSKELNTQVKGNTIDLDDIVPATSIIAIPRNGNCTAEFKATYIEAGMSIIESMRLARKEARFNEHD